MKNITFHYLACFYLKNISLYGRLNNLMIVLIYLSKSYFI